MIRQRWCLPRAPPCLLALSCGRAGDSPSTPLAIRLTDLFDEKKTLIDTATPGSAAGANRMALRRSRRRTSTGRLRRHARVGSRPRRHRSDHHERPVDGPHDHPSRSCASSGHRACRWPISCTRSKSGSAFPQGGQSVGRTSPSERPAFAGDQRADAGSRQRDHHAHHTGRGGSDLRADEGAPAPRLPDSARVHSTERCPRCDVCARVRAIDLPAGASGEHPVGCRLAGDARGLCASPSRHARPNGCSSRSKCPPAAWLDVALGTVDEGAVSSQSACAVTEGPTGDGQVLLEHTLTTPYRWEPRAINLSRFSGQDVTLTLGVRARRSGALGCGCAGRAAARSLTEPIAGATAALGRPPQGVIVVWADTLRKDHLDAYGYERATAPSLRRFASDGVLFKNSTSQATWTKVATPSILTSLYPSTHGVVNFDDRLPAAATTLAEV